MQQTILKLYQFTGLGPKLDCLGRKLIPNITERYQIMKILFMLSAMLLGFSEAGEGPNGVTTGSSDLYKLSEDQVCSLLVHSNLSHLQSIVKREGLNGISYLFILDTAVLQFCIFFF